jgi:hypothetical protein
MTRAERMAAFPCCCQVRRVDNPSATGHVAGWGRTYDVIYVVRPGFRSGPLPYPAGQWERCDVAPAPVFEPAVEAHW